MNQQTYAKLSEGTEETPKQAQSPAYAATLAGLMSFGLAALLLVFVEQRELLLAITALIAVLFVGLWKAAEKWSLRDKRIDRCESFTLNTLALFKILAFFVSVQYVMQIALDLFTTSNVKLPNLVLMLACLIMLGLSFVPFVTDTILIFPASRSRLLERYERQQHRRHRVQTDVN